MNPRLEQIHSRCAGRMPHTVSAAQLGDVDVMVKRVDVVTSLEGRREPRRPSKPWVVTEIVRVSNVEDAHPAGPDQQSDDDQYDAPEELPAEKRQDAGHHKYYRQDPKNECHAAQVPELANPETR
jgi:hypothetical protein